MELEQNAPLKARQELLVDAPVARVWAVQTDIAAWPKWQPDVSSATLEGPLAPGSIFRWKAMGLGITSTLQEVESERRIGWTGRSVGMRAVHRWRFEPRGAHTLVVTEESLSGWFARLLKVFDRKFLDKSLARSLEVLKARVEGNGRP
jgi:uncharacterized membrane protein